MRRCWPDAGFFALCSFSVMKALPLSWKTFQIMADSGAMCIFLSRVHTLPRLRRLVAGGYEDTVMCRRFHAEIPRPCSTATFRISSSPSPLCDPLHLPVRYGFILMRPQLPAIQFSLIALSVYIDLPDKIF